MNLFGKPVSTFPDHARQIKRKQNAARRICLSMSRISGCGARLDAARSPDGVPLRHLRQRANAAAQLQNALPGTRLPAGVIRRPLSQSSDKVGDRSSCRPGVFPKAARERRRRAPARGNRSCPIGRCHPADVLWWVRFAGCNDIGYNYQVTVANIATLSCDIDSGRLTPRTDIRQTPKKCR